MNNIKDMRYSSVFSDIKKKGYHEFSNYYFDQGFYDKLYENFALVSFLIRNDTNFIEINKEIEENFFKFNSQLNEDIIIISENSLGFNILKSQKRKYKIFLHYNNRYHNFIISYYKETLNKYEPFSDLLDKLNKVYTTSYKLFENNISILNGSITNLKESIYTKNKELIIYVKIGLHDPEDRIAENIHYDWSGFTMILHNNDTVKYHLHITNYLEDWNKLKFEPYKKYIERIGSKHFIKSIIFPGAALKKRGIDLYPSPHFVEKVSEYRRYSLLSFCMVPGVDSRFLAPEDFSNFCLQSN